ncbi:MAG TPA: hypothetical protein VM818_16660 [Vicinamibacterales bacterium]|nr:hypothetical protein [Vicinamibacterales bacterium]
MRAILAVVLLVVVPAVSYASQSAADAYEIAEYRLTEPVFKRFVEASRLIEAVTRADPRFDEAPLFTKEIALSGDVVVEASALAARLEADPRLAAALRTAKLSAPEYAKFALVLVAARLAVGFIDAGVIAGARAGAPADNVDFFRAHQANAFEVLGMLRVRD